MMLTPPPTSEVVAYGPTGKTTAMIQRRTGARRPRRGQHSTLIYVTVPGVPRNTALREAERAVLRAAATRVLEALAADGTFPQLKDRPGGLPAMRYSPNRGAFVMTGFTLRGTPGGVIEHRPVDLFIEATA